jgi:MoxR-like ATPase
MALADAARDSGQVEECVDELSDLIERSQRFAPAVLAVALRVHLETLLQALLEARLCSREEVRDFVRELERDALQYETD